MANTKNSKSQNSAIKKRGSCKICDSGEREHIDYLLDAGIKYEEIRRSTITKPSHKTIQEHRKKCGTSQKEYAEGKSKELEETTNKFLNETSQQINDVVSKAKSTGIHSENVEELSNEIKTLWDLNNSVTVGAIEKLWVLAEKTSNIRVFEVLNKFLDTHAEIRKKFQKLLDETLEEKTQVPEVTIVNSITDPEPKDEAKEPGAVWEPADDVEI